MQHSHIMAKKTKEHWTVLWIDQKQSQAIPPAWFIQLKEQKKKKKIDQVYTTGTRKRDYINHY